MVYNIKRAAISRSLAVSRLLGKIYTVLYRPVHQALSELWINRVSTFQGEVYINRIGQIVGAFESVRIIEVSAFQGVRKVGFHCVQLGSLQCEHVWCVCVCVRVRVCACMCACMSASFSGYTCYSKSSQFR